MSLRHRASGVVVAATLGLFAAMPAAGGWSGFVALETRAFVSAPAAPAQDDHRGSFSFVFEPSYFGEWSDGRWNFVLTGFGRYDSRDAERTHLDARELYVQAVGERWELSIGARKHFWGVTESFHLVDFLNQTDLVEDFDGEDKLGQPMIELALIRDWGTVQLFVMPFFRERTFPGIEGRVRAALPVDHDLVRYESSAGSDHVDWAVRWSHAIGPFDIGVAHFVGTNREPFLVPALNAGGAPVLAPVYEQVDRTSLDLQATVGGWLWKLESIHQRGLFDDHWAAVGGFEYTFSNLESSGVDVGVLAEYLWDDRGALATTPFTDDLFVGSRVAINDIADTTFLFGAIIDLDAGSTFVTFEGSRRFGQDFRLNLEARALFDVPADDLFFTLRRDDYLQLTIARYF